MEHAVTLITALTPMVLSIMAGIGWLVKKRIEAATPPGAAPPTTAPPVTPPDVTTTAWLQGKVDAWTARALAAEERVDVLEAALREAGAAVPPDDRPPLTH